MKYREEFEAWYNDNCTGYGELEYVEKHSSLTFSKISMYHLYTGFAAGYDAAIKEKTCGLK